MVVDEARLAEPLVDPGVRTVEEASVTDGLGGPSSDACRDRQGTSARTRAGLPDPSVSGRTPTTTQAPSGGTLGEVLEALQVPHARADG